MFEETPEKPANGTDPADKLAQVVESLDNRKLLTRIERNTAVLPALLKALTTAKGTKGAHVYVRDIQKASKAAKTAVAATPSSSPVAPRTSTRRKGATVAPVTPVPTPTTPVSSTPVRTVSRTPRARQEAANTTPATSTPAQERQRARNGRFLSAGERERERQSQEKQANGLKGWFKAAMAAVIGKGKEKSGDVEDAAGKAVGGPFYEAVKEMQGAASELREKLLDDKTALGKTARWFGKKTGLLKGPTAPPTEGAEQRRHRELIQTIEGHTGGGGGGGGSGVAEAIGGGVAGGGLRSAFSQLKRVPGAAVAVASRFLSKAAPLVSILTSGATIATLGTITALAAGYAGIMSIINRGKENGWHDQLSPDQTNAIRPGAGGGPSKGFRDSMKGAAQSYAPQGNVVAAIPGATTTVDAQGNVVKRSGNRNWRNHNPGNLEYGPFAKSMGATGSDGRYAVFPDYQTGRKAMKEKLFTSDEYKGRTLSSAVAKWAPTEDGNDTAKYQRTVLKTVGGKDKKMSDYTPAEQQKILDAMQAFEGFRPGTVEQVKATSRKPKVAPAKGTLRQSTAVAPAQDLVQAPVTAQLMGTEELIKALNRQAAPKKETADPAPIRTQFDNTTLALMSVDRI